MWSFLINRFRFSALLILTIVLMGLISMVVLPKEAMPEVKIPYAAVVTMYAGASPVDVEELITEPIEEGISGLEDMKMTQSFSSEGVSMVFVEFEADADIKDSVRALQDAVSGIEGQLPEDGDNPIVSELNYSNTPILIASISADMSHTELVGLAEDLQSDILEISNVSEVELIGVRDKEVTIEIDPTALAQYGVSIMEILAAIQGAESNMPLGAVESNDMQYTLRFSADLEPEDIENLIVRTGEAPIYMRDLGDVDYKIADASQYSRISLEGGVPEDAISLSVYKKTGGDIIEMVDEIYEKVEDLEGRSGADITFFTSVDYAEDIKQQLGNLSFSGLQTILLVAIILFLSLGVREAIVAGLAIPLTFLITFTGMSMFGSSINFLSLFSLILALGILVDTGIVITEGMHVKLAKGGDPKKVALETVREYQLPLISGTMTTVAAFVPMLLMTGIIGSFVRHIPITVSLTLLASLFVGLGLLPVIGSRVLKANGTRKKSFIERTIGSVKEYHRDLLAWLTEKRRRQHGLIGGMILLFCMSCSLLVTGILEPVMFTEEDYRYFYIEVSLEQGTLLDETNAVVEEIEGYILETPEVESFVTTVGKSSDLADGGLVGAVGGSAHLANLTVNLKEDRERSSLEIVDDFRAEFAGIANADIRVINLSDGPPSAAPIEFKIVGSDLDKLKEYADEAIEVLEQVPGAINLSSSLENTVNEFVLSVDRQKAAEAGLTPLMLSQIARISVNGMVAQTLKVDGEDTDVILRTSADTDIEEILALPIVTAYGTHSLSYFVDMSFEPAPSSILHIDGDRIVTISGDLDTGHTAASVLADFQERVDIDMDNGYRLEYGGEYEEMVESFESLGRSMLFGILLIIVILVLQFNSYRQVAMVVFTIPLALIGVFPGLVLAGYPFSFPVFVGIVALAGIVVNNAIILIDRINRNIAGGMEKREAILEAGGARFQPILLTSITTIAGILPLTLSDPTWGPLGFTIICGLAFSTILTLIVVPGLYMRFAKK